MMTSASSMRTGVADTMFVYRCRCDDQTGGSARKASRPIGNAIRAPAAFGQLVDGHPQQCRKRIVGRARHQTVAPHVVE